MPEAYVVNTILLKELSWVSHARYRKYQNGKLIGITRRNRELSMHASMTLTTSAACSAVTAKGCPALIAW